jgi:hypothetical protein
MDGSMAASKAGMMPPSPTSAGFVAGVERATRRSNASAKPRSTSGSTRSAWVIVMRLPAPTWARLVREPGPGATCSSTVRIDVEVRSVVVAVVHGVRVSRVDRDRSGPRWQLERDRAGDECRVGLAGGAGWA